MPPIQMTRKERATLARLVKSPAPVSDIPADQIDKFINYGLAVREVYRLRLTTKGQLEMFRQRFRRMGHRRTVMTPSHDFLGQLDRHIERRPPAPTEFYSLDDDEEEETPVQPRYASGRF